VLIVLVLAQVLGVANANLIAIALPSLSEDLGASGTEQQWIVDVYVLVFAALLITAGVLADRYGRRRALVAGLLVFAVASLACALASSPAVLIAARVAQGLGPPLILPASLAIVMTSYASPQARARAVGLWGAGSGIGVAAGPLLGGVLVGALGWRAAFAFNVPAALVLAVLGLRLVPPHRPEPAGGRFDRAGAVLVTVAMAATVFALIEGPKRGWLSAPVVGAVVAVVVLLAIFTVVERRHPDPLVELTLLRQPTFAAANAGAATLMFAMLPSTVYLSTFLQTFRDLTPLAAGAALLPLGVAVAAFAAVSGRLTARLAPRVHIAAGLFTGAAGAFALSRTGAGSGPADVWPALLLIGAGAGIALPASTATAVGAATAARTGMASAIHNTGRQLGATLGVAALGSIILARARPGSAAAYADGLSAAGVVAGAVLTLAAVVTLLLVPSARAGAAGRPPPPADAGA
jgi:DHA2 family methylenomycin A resistance protein-like MFS transporter